MMRRNTRADWTCLLALCCLSLAPFAAQAADRARFDCVMDPPITLKLGGSMPGLLKEVLVKRGDRVKAGDVIARLESSVERAGRELIANRAKSDARIAAAQARSDFVVSRRRQIEKLLARGVATRAAMDEIRAEEVAARSALVEAQADRTLAQLELARADAMLAVREIRSPIDGVITERALGPGEFLHQDVHVATAVKLDPLHVETFVPVAFYDRITVGERAKVHPAAPVNGVFEATITVVDPVFDAASGTFGVRLELPNPSGALPAGHRCTVAFNGVGADETAAIGVAIKVE